MLKLAIVGHDQQSIKHLKSELKERLTEYKDIRIATSRPGYLESAIDSHLKVLVFDTNAINRNLFPFVVQIRKTGFTGPILILGNPVSHFNLNEISEVRNLFQLGKPFDSEHLVGMVRNCINVEGMKQRRDKRFDVREVARIEAYRSDYQSDAVINNISRSGLRIEGNLHGLNQGDLLRLHFYFDQIQKERTMSARVVWLKKGDDNLEQAGLAFVSQKTVYQYLLEYATA